VKEEKCEVCDSTADLIERVFCSLVSKLGVQPESCKNLMERKRRKEIEYNQLVEGLNLTKEQFNHNLDLALKKAEMIIKTKKRGEVKG